MQVQVNNVWDRMAVMDKVRPLKQGIQRITSATCYRWAVLSTEKVRQDLGWCINDPNSVADYVGWGSEQSGIPGWGPVMSHVLASGRRIPEPIEVKFYGKKVLVLQRLERVTWWEASDQSVNHNVLK